MCGIGGQFLHSDQLPQLERLNAMASAMRYRGPDDEGIYRAKHIGLVQRRLSIRDLSEAGHCPMGSTDSRFFVVFNGEIYNWRELRQELEARGVEFNSQTDTEVILQGYRAWGRELLSRLRGMFAFAIWDGETHRLLLSRDRAGEKPLFYQESPNGLIFASTTEALKAVQGQRFIDPIAIASYLSHSFIPASHTVWQKLKVLPPAHVLTIESGKAPELERYWDFPQIGPINQPLSICEGAVESVLDDSVVRCMDADVPVGIFLSGGVDSSLVAALAARHRARIPAFSLGFAEIANNELPYACQVAEHLGLEHYSVEISVDDVIETLPHLVRQYGQPFGDSSSIPSFCVARLAREHVKVCLSGDGGDESFGGYWRMQSGVYSARYAACLPNFVRKHVIPVIGSPLGSFGRRLLAMNNLSLQPAGAGYNNAQSWFGQLIEIAGPALRPALSVDLASLRVGQVIDRPEASVMQRLIYDDFQVQLPDAYLTKVDVASMAASLEVRAPFLDQKVLELAWSLPNAAKLNWGRRKWLLKRIAACQVPPEVIYRPKRGFTMPLVHWFRGRLGKLVEDLLADSIAVTEGWIQVGPVRKCLREHQKGHDHTTRLWLVLWLELWFRLVVRNEQLAL